jgi:branched-chain amino acid transport system permease protein
MYYLCLAALVLVVLVVHTTLRTRTGRVLRATRDNPRAAAAMAVPTARVQLAGFVLAGVIAGSAGALHATLLRGVGYQTYPVATSILVFSMAVIGGISSLGGTLIGVAFVQGLTLAVPRLALVFTGVALLVVLYAAPGGIGLPGDTASSSSTDSPMVPREHRRSIATDGCRRRTPVRVRGRTCCAFRA